MDKISMSHEDYLEAILMLGGCVEVLMMIAFTELWHGVDWRGKLLLLETSEDGLSPDYLLWTLRGMAADGMFDKINGIVM